MSIYLKKWYHGEWIVQGSYGSTTRKEISSWLRATWGEGSHNKKSAWRESQLGFHQIYIRGDANAMLFQLRWCGVTN